MRLHRVLALAGAALVLAVQARAGSLPAGVTPTLSLVATSGAGDGLSLSPTSTLNADGTYSAHGSEVSGSFSLVFDLKVNPDPSVIGSFTLTNLSNVTQFFSVSATMATLPVAGPTKMGGFYGDVTYTDANKDSTVTLATNGVDPFYRALIDAVAVKGLGSFNDTAFGGPGVFGTISQDSWGTPIPSAPGPGVASSVGVSFPAFSLTAGDSVQVPFEFIVNAPEPSFASLFATGITLILLATAHRKLFLGD